MHLTVTVFILFVSSLASAYKVLIIHPTPSYSHQLPAMALTERLVKKGHHVTVISPNVVPELKENYTFVDMSFSYQFATPSNKTDVALDFQKQISKWDLAKMFPTMGKVVELQLTSAQFLEFKRRVQEEKLSFDVIICESFLAPYCMGVAHVLGSLKPVIGFITGTMDIFLEEHLGNFRHLSYTPSEFDSYTDKMSIWQKIENWVSDRYLTKHFESGISTSAVKFFTENYGPEYEEYVNEYKTKISLVMISSNFLYNYPRALTPNVIEIGAMHIKPPQKLPQVLQDWCDGAEKGVIYMSLGSNMKSESLPKSVRSNWLKVFKELPAGYRVIWKLKSDSPIMGLPNNVLLQKWLPQQSVLAHPKVKVFVTQGGLQSFQETVHWGVPTIGIPWFGDQEQNVAKMVDSEIGVRLRPSDLYSYDKIKEAINALLFNERYTENMKKISAISHDFTSTAVDKAVFWVEHVARHGGAPHLRPSTADATYFQWFCLDILPVILVFIVVLVYSVFTVFKYLFSLLCSKSNEKIKKS